MIIDAHTHLWGSKSWLPEWYWPLLNKFQATGFGVTIQEMERMREESWDPSGDTFVKTLDDAGVDKALACVWDAGMKVGWGDADVPIEEINQLTYEVVQKHSERLIFAVGTDPRRRNTQEIVERGIKQWGAKALKLHPAVGWYPDDRIAYPLYEMCTEAGIIVDIHTGIVGYPFKCKYAMPIYIDEVAVDFPGLTIQCTHSGHGFFMDMIAIARHRSNVVLDLAGWHPWVLHGESLSMYRTIRYMMNMVGSNRIMFASDWVGLPGTKHYAEWVKAFTQIPPEVKAAGIVFSEKEVADLLGGNAGRILGL